jgi:hypothetical protein
MPTVEPDLTAAAIGMCLFTIAVPSLTGQVVLAGIFNTDTVFKSALENFD